MTVYKAAGESSNSRTLRILTWGAVTLLLCICIVSYYDSGLGDPARRALAWAAAAVVFSVVVLAAVVSSRDGLRNFAAGFQFEVSDGKIIQRRTGKETVEIPLVQVESLHQYHDWLIVKGGEPPRQITIPSEVRGFEELKQQLSAYRPLTPLRLGVRLYTFFPLILWVACCFFLFTSHNIIVVLTAGSAVLLLQGLRLYLVWRRRRNVLRPKLVLVVEASIWLLTAWIVYQRSKGAL